MPYTPYYDPTGWEDDPSQDTPIVAAALENMETGIGDATDAIENHIADTADAHDASAISVLDAANQFTGTDVEAVLAEVQDNLDAHLSDGTDAHDASAISVTPAGTISSTDVQSALQELEGDIIGGGIPSTIVDAKGDLVGASAADTPAKVSAATADGLVLTSDSAQATGVKWAAASAGAGALTALSDVEGGAGTPQTGEAPVWDGDDFTYTDVATQAELDAHLNDASDAHDASAISVLDAANQLAATDVEAALAEIQDNLDAHLADTSDAHDASAISFSPTGTIASTDVQAAIAEVASEAGSGSSDAYQSWKTWR